MNILRLISKYSTLLMPALSIVGLLLPSVSNALLPWLAKILFFLMFFTLLGIDQTALFHKIKSMSVWRFALIQNSLVCVLLTISAYLLGARGELLLAISAVGATAPLFGSGAIVNAMGFDALLAMAKTIVATLLMPITLFMVLSVLAEEGAYLDIVEYTRRLFIYILCPMVLSIICKRMIPPDTLSKYYPKIGQFNILLVLAFPLGLMGGFRQTFDDSPTQALRLFVIACGLMLLIFCLTYLVAHKLFRHEKQRAIIASTVSSGRNLLLTLTIAMPFVGAMFLPLVGALQLPIFSVPFIGKWLIKKLS